MQSLMTFQAAGVVIVLLALMIGAARVIGRGFERIYQPRVAGEITAGFLVQLLLVSLSVSGLIAGASTLPQGADAVLSAVSWMGALLLMFVSGAEVQQLSHPDEQRRIGLMSIFGDGVPFVLVAFIVMFLPIEQLMGPAASRPSLVLIIAISAAVTSVPVISKIFSDLGILKTRFASIVLGVGVLGDTALWAVLALATALARSVNPNPSSIVLHFALDVLLLVGGLRYGAAAVRGLLTARWNAMARRFPSVLIVAVCVGYMALLSALGVSIVFSAFLAGVAVSRESALAPVMRLLRPVSTYALIPAYFAIAGFRLDLLGGTFPVVLFLVFLIGSSLLKITTMSFSSRLAGFRFSDAFNIALSTNARGGPGIVVATVARETGIVSNGFYTVLVLTAIVTSQMAGAWLDFVLRRGWRLIEEPHALRPAQETHDGIRRGAETR